VPPPAVVQNSRGILVLPAEFTVFQHSTVATEPVPGWTEDAKRNLTDSARRVLGGDGRFQVIEVPQLPDDQASVLREHIELFKLIGSQIEAVVKPGGKAWQDTRANADYRIGPGLAFLKQQTGAQYAFVMAGAEIRQTGGSIFMQMLLAGLTGMYSVGAGTSCTAASSISIRAGSFGSVPRSASRPWASAAVPTRARPPVPTQQSPRCSRATPPPPG
jgi:hypothetical protein